MKEQSAGENQKFLFGASCPNLLYPISGQNQAGDSLPEVRCFCAVIPAVWNFMKRYDPVRFIQPCLKPIWCVFRHRVSGRSAILCFERFLIAHGFQILDIRLIVLQRFVCRCGPGIWRGCRRNSCRRWAPSILSARRPEVLSENVIAVGI